MVMGAAQAAHAAPASAVPQLAQKRPVAAAPQEGQALGTGAGVGTGAGAEEEEGIVTREK
jgi:hypothetical protein